MDYFQDLIGRAVVDGDIVVVTTPANWWWMLLLGGSFVEMKVFLGGQRNGDQTFN